MLAPNTRSVLLIPSQTLPPLNSTLVETTDLIPDLSARFISFLATTSSGDNSGNININLRPMVTGALLSSTTQSHDLSPPINKRALNSVVTSQTWTPGYFASIQGHDPITGLAPLDIASTNPNVSMVQRQVLFIWANIVSAEI